MAERNNLTADWRESASSPGAPGVTGGAERSADEIRQDIAARRETITEAVDRLSDRFQRTLDWRAYVSDYPLAALGIAAGAGFLVARIFKPRQSPGERIKDALAYGIEDLTSRVRYQLDGFTAREHGFGVGRTVKAAATGLITKAVTDYLQNRSTVPYQQYPDYRAEYTESNEVSSY
ncbi:MAG: hypothetical protein MOB07_00270 [Acidobacteria bacterium]|nr:hypothetical protein [Acidobacteriota bacterium]